MALSRWLAGAAAFRGSTVQLYLWSVRRVCGPWFCACRSTLAATFYGSGRNDLQRATSEKLFKEARCAGWLRESDLATFEKARRLRNPLVHFRVPLHEDLPESRSFKEDRDPYEVVESDAKQILEVVFRLVAQNAVG
jgi:hypothetical protein